ncbi:MAG: hypothetical protein SFX73_35310 [Kofleriaceae bacterium]|nr:hypothetical protein [Kofleriaceae bacterium]
MRIAETAVSRTLIVISSLGLAGAIAAMLLAPSPEPEVRVPHGPLRPMRGCAYQQPRVAPPVAPPVEQTVARTHSELVHALRPELERCVEGGVEATLAFVTRRDGSVGEVKLEGNLGPRPEALVACMNAVVKPVMFPPSETELRVEMLLSND